MFLDDLNEKYLSDLRQGTLTVKQIEHAEHAVHPLKGLTGIHYTGAPLTTVLQQCSFNVVHVG